MTHPKCFISYSWDSNDHKDWVRHLASELQRNGVVTYLDQWDVYPGMDLPEYMETRIRESNFVLLVCTPIFAQKANASRGGVGYEKNIVTGEIFEGAVSPKKFMPLLRKGSQTESLPSYLKSRVYIDFRNDATFANSMELLLRHVYESPKYVRHPLGSRPRLGPVGIEQPTDVKQPSMQLQLGNFKDLYEFACSVNGLNMDKMEAAEWAEAWMERFADKNFETFKEVYDKGGYAWLAVVYDSLGNRNLNSWGKNNTGDWSDSKATTLRVGHRVNLRAIGHCSVSSKLEYRFSLQRSGRSFQIHQDWLPDPDWTWVVENLDIGREVCVMISVRRKKDYYQFGDADDYTYAVYEVLPAISRR